MTSVFVKNIFNWNQGLWLVSVADWESPTQSAVLLSQPAGKLNLFFLQKNGPINSDGHVYEIIYLQEINFSFGSN